MKRRSVKECSQFVSYLRTSTEDQRLSIDAQRESVTRLATHRACSIAREFVEHESSGDNDRDELNRAINHARRIGAILVVAKLDRLSRDLEFLARLSKGNVPILFGDMPGIDATTPAGRLQIGVMSALAEFELERMKERMRDWHRAKKAQGFKAGTPANLTAAGRAEGVKVSAIRRVARAIDEMGDIIPIILKLRADGGTLQAIADHLNAEGYTTRQGGKWSTTQVLRIIRRSK